MSALYDFFLNNGYILEILLANELFTWWIARKKHFALRLLVGVLAAMSFSWLLNLLNLPADNTWIQIVKYLLCFLLPIPIVYFLHKITITQAAFYATVASVAQHLSFQIGKLFSYFLYIRYSGVLSAEVYDVTYAVMEILSLIGCHFTFARYLRRVNPPELKRGLLLVLMIFMQFSTNFFSTLFISINPHPEILNYSAFATYDVGCCFLLLILVCGLCLRIRNEQDNAVLKRLLYQQKEQLQTSKATIERINIKCHDIQNQIATLGRNIPQEGIDELKRAINIYDMNIETGNEALDVILTEKTLLCDSEGIRLDCMADGTALSFMSQADIYSLFINLLDNAIEAVDQLTESDFRSIRIRVQRKMGMAVIHIDNPYKTMPEFRNGIPLTTKANKENHGYGVLSIRNITEKYGGRYSVDAGDGLFKINIMMPIPGEADA